MKKIFLISCFCCLFTTNSFSQVVAIYIKTVSTTIKPYSQADLYYVQNDSVHQNLVIVPSSHFVATYFIDSTKPVTRLMFDVKNNTVKPFMPISYYPISGDLQYYSGDSIIFDMDKKSATIINKK